MAPKPWAFGNLIIGSEYQDRLGDIYSHLEGGYGLPQVEALMADRYGRFPIVGGIRRQARRLTVKTHFLTAATRAAYRLLVMQELNPESEDAIRFTIVDDLLPGLTPENLLLAFGPWDLYHDGSNWRVRGILEQGTGTLVGTTWEISPGVGLDIISGTDKLTVTSTDLSGVNAIEVIWKPTDDYSYATDRYLFDGGDIELYVHDTGEGVKFYLTDGTTTISSANTQFAADALQHIVARFSVAGAGEMKLTINGTEVTGLGTVTAFGATCYIGSEATPSKWERGNLVAFRFYDDLTSAETTKLYNAYNTASGDPIGNARHVDVIAQSVDPLQTIGPRALDLVSTLMVDGDVRWRSRDGDYWHWDVTATGDTETVAVSTEDEAYPIFYITPPAIRGGGFSYKCWVSGVWKANAVTYYSIKLGTMDTSALIKTATTTTLDGNVLAADTTISLTDASSFPTAGMAYITDAVPGDEQISWTGKSGNDLTGCLRGLGGTGADDHTDLDAIAVSKMLANGADLRVYNGSTEIDRWIQDIDTATTDVWVVRDFEAESSATLGTAIGAGETITTITASQDISDFPSEGILWIDAEAFTYRGRNNTARQFENVVRAAKGTSAAEHTTADTIYWIQHDLWIMYGDQSLSAPTTDDDYKPIVVLDTSTNDLWYYEEFGEDSKSRPGGWIEEIIAGAPVFYGGNQGAAATPWVEIGVYNDEAAGNQGRIYLYNICGVTNSHFENGENRSNVDTEAWIFKVRSSPDGVTWTDEENFGNAAANQWQAWAYDTALTAGAHYVSLDNTASSVNGRWLEAADCHVNLDTTYTPDLTIGSEQEQYQLDCKIENTTTGVAIELEASLNIDDVLEVDTDAKTITNLTEGENLYGALTLVGGVRRDWLPLQDGDNVFEYTEAGVADLDIDIVWDRRSFE